MKHVPEFDNLPLKNQKTNNVLYQNLKIPYVIQQRVREVEKDSFDPIVFSTTGGTGHKATEFLKGLAHKILDKRGESYKDVMGFLRTKLRFSLLRSVLISVRGERGKPSAREPHLQSLPFNLIPREDNYDC